MWNFLNNMWNKAEGVFDRVADIEVAKYEADRMPNAFTADAGIPSGSYTGTTLDGGFVISANMIAIVVVGVAAFLLLKK